MNTILQITVKLGDILLGWLFYLPQDLRFLALALITTVLMSVCKYLVVDVDWLSRARNDLKTLASLIKNARAEKDKSALERYRYTCALIRMKQLKAELKSLVIVLIPLLLIGTWSWYRMEHNSPVKNETLEVTVRAPASAIGQIIYLVPSDGVQPDQRAKTIDPSSEGPFPGSASWTLRLASPGKSFLLSFRSGNTTVEQPVVAVGNHYKPPPPRDQGIDLYSKLVMEEARLFGIVPGSERIGIPAWVVAYLLLVLLLLPLSRRILKVS
ncbi:hypothetical protein BVX94_02775 [bacterium B17]|nr:hypothetical protein BVX94_02775 [bacterium B17]